MPYAEAHHYVQSVFTLLMIRACATGLQIGSKMPGCTFSLSLARATMVLPHQYDSAVSAILILLRRRLTL